MKIADEPTARYPFTLFDPDGWTREPLEFTFASLGGLVYGTCTRNPETKEVTSFRLSSPFTPSFYWGVGAWNLPKAGPR